MPPRASQGASFIQKENTDILEDHLSINAREARSNFSKIVEAARYKSNRVIITDHGEPAAGLVSIDDVRMLDILDRLEVPSKIEGTNIRELTVDELRTLILGEEVRSEDANVQLSEGDSG